MSSYLVVACVLGAAILIGVGVYVSRSRRSERSQPHPRRDTTEDVLDPEDLRVIRDRLKAFERDSVAFELFLAGNRTNLSAEDRSRLAERYGHVVQEPVLVLSDLAERGLDFGLVGTCVATLLREKGLTLDESLTFGRAASDAIRARARATAANILEETTSTPQL